MGFSGRSDAIRAGIRSFVAEEKQNQNLSGNINANEVVLEEGSKFEGEVDARIIVIEGEPEEPSLPAVAQRSMTRFISAATESYNDFTEFLVGQG